MSLDTHSSSSRLGEYASRSSRTEMERLNRGYAVRSIDATTCAPTSPQSDMNERYRNRADTRCVGELRIVFTRGTDFRDFGIFFVAVRLSANRWAQSPQGCRVSCGGQDQPMAGFARISVIPVSGHAEGPDTGPRPF